MGQACGPGGRERTTAGGIPVKPVYTDKDLEQRGPLWPLLRGPAQPGRPVVISGCEVRKAGATAVQELAHTLAQAIEFVEAAASLGEAPAKFASRVCFRISVKGDIFEEIAKLRAARRLWARALDERFGVTPRDSTGVRIEARVALTPLGTSHPYDNVIRTTLAALAGVLGGADSVDTSALAGAGGLPREIGTVLARRVMQVIEHESGGGTGFDTLQGSFYIECLTSELESRAWELLAGGGEALPRDR